jgi:flagellar biosynthesis chaperone FliJ
MIYVQVNRYKFIQNIRQNLQKKIYKYINLINYLKLKLNLCSRNWLKWKLEMDGLGWLLIIIFSQILQYWLHMDYQVAKNNGQTSKQRWVVKYVG